MSTPTVNISTPEVAFGGAVAREVQQLGRAVDNLGGTIFKRAEALQELRSKTEAEEAETQYLIESGKLHAAYNSSQGKNAVDAFPKYQEDLAALRTSIGDTLSNPMSRRQYDSSTNSIMGRHIFNGAGHAAAQNKRWVAGTADAKIDEIRDSALHNPQDDVAFERGVRDVQRQVRSTLSPIAGWGKEQEDKAVSEKVSELYAFRIIGMARTEPFRAKEYLEANRDKLRYDDLDKADRAVATQMRSTGSRIISDKVSAPSEEGKEVPLEERLATGKKEAERIAPDDAVFEDYVRERIIADYNRGKVLKREQELGYRNTIEGALMGNFGGKIPTTREELIAADPKVEQAWNALDEIHQRSYLKALAANAKGDRAWSPEGLKKYQELKGLAAQDPVEFMSQNVVDLSMPWSARRELVNLQQRMKAKAEGDPRVSRALQALNPVMIAAGVDRARDREGYYQFVGGLQEALDVFQQQNKRQPKFEELKEIGQRLLQEQYVPDKYWLFGGKTPLYQLKPPEDVIEAIRTDPQWTKIGVTPTEEQIRQIYVRKRYQELFGGSPKKPDGPQVPRSQ